ncbi:hypothetical protein F9Y90_05340 (plasmid) [Borrelia miyamotoi]|uniref:DUF228 domain-containing protein n=1 Tax=Borrelia miyamotoi TaxID=47466 RepID=A0A5P8ARS7_9SPIR|nr:DUF228 domain-containing protein [Borrelia miyamotoi]QFP42523.1 hypothetical protein F9Y90_05340 [Borrelia miyamotoi]WVI05556.1 DUF228 domain-containing protein [Borrelia miyamotoi]WVI05597.1 DUF228 domain-containing protein [Borrelia miyamotoi]
MSTLHKTSNPKDINETQDQIDFLTSLDIETLSTLDTLEDVESLREESNRAKRRGKRHTPSQVASLDTQYTEALLKLKQYTKTHRENKASFSAVKSGFQDKMQILDADALAISSSVDCIKKYPYKGYPYKRAVKLTVENGTVYVVADCDEEMYGICIDICEITHTATVIPITNNFEGYLAASDQSIKIADKLDFDSNGMLIKAGNGGKRMINAIALSDVFSIDLASDDSTRKGQYVLHFVQVSVYGNRF